MDKYLEVKVRDLGNDTFELAQPHLVDRIIEFVELRDAKPRETPVGKPLLNKDLNGTPRNYEWNYQAAVGMLNYLLHTLQPEIAMAVHQCGRFNNNPMLSHEKAVKRIVKYLKRHPDRGIIYKVENPED